MSHRNGPYRADMEDDTVPDPLGAIIGLAAVAIIIFLFRHCEALEDGNVGGEDADY